jgi:hypothetical protein
MISADLQGIAPFVVFDFGAPDSGPNEHDVWLM